MSDEQKQKSNVYVFKVLLIGDGATGKTSLRRRYMGEGFISDYLDTVGADFAYLSEEVVEDGILSVYQWSIWDLAGQPKFSNVRPVFYQGAFGALLVFDATRPATFENLDKWVDELRRHTSSEGVPLVLIANKMDVYNNEISFEDVEKYVEELKSKLGNRFEVSHIKTSAKTGENVKDAFKMLRESIINWIREDD